MQLNALVRHHEEGLAIAFQNARDLHRAAEDKTRLRPRIVHARSKSSAGDNRILVGNALVGIRIEVGVAEGKVSRSMILFRSCSQHRVGHYAVSMSILGIVGCGLNLHLLHCLRRRHKACVAGSGEALRWVVGNAVERQPVVTAAAVHQDLHRSAAEGVGKTAGLALHVVAGVNIRRQGGQDKRVAANIWHVGDVHGRKRCIQIGRSRVQLLVVGCNRHLICGSSRLQNKIGVLNSARGQHDAGARLGAKTRRCDSHRIGVGREERDRVFACAVRGGLRLKSRCHIRCGHVSGNDLCAGSVGHAAAQCAEVLLSPDR